LKDETVIESVLAFMSGPEIGERKFNPKAF
jgi:hypothetical protein